MAGLDRLAELRRKFLMDRQQRSAQAPAQGAALAGQGIDALARYQQQMAAQNQAKALAQSKAAQALERQRHNQAVEAQAAAAMAQQKQMAEAKAKALAAQREAENRAADAKAGLIGPQAADADITEMVGMGMDRGPAQELARTLMEHPAGDVQEATRMDDARFAAKEADWAKQDAASLAAQRAEAKEGRAVSGEQRAQEKHQKAMDKSGGPRKLPKPKFTEAKKVTDSQVAIKALGDLLTQKPQINTGPLVNLWVDFKDWAGMQQDPGVSEFRTSVMYDLTQKISKWAGANVAPEEKKRILSALPNMRDSDEEFEKKARALMARIDDEMKGDIRALEAAGKDVSSFTATPTPAAPAAPKQVSTPGGGMFNLTDEQIAKLSPKARAMLGL